MRKRCPFCGAKYMHDNMELRVMVGPGYVKCCESCVTDACDRNRDATGETIGEYKLDSNGLRRTR